MKSLFGMAVAGFVAAYLAVASVAAAAPAAAGSGEVTLEGKIEMTVGDGAIRAVTLTTGKGKVYQIALDDRGENLGKEMDGKTVTVKGGVAGRVLKVTSFVEGSAAPVAPTAAPAEQKKAGKAKPAAEQPAAAEPATEQPAAAEPAQEQPAAVAPATEQPAAPAPGEVKAKTGKGKGGKGKTGKAKEQKAPGDAPAADAPAADAPAQ